ESVIRGSARPKLDDKWRVALSPKFRDRMSHDLVVVCEMEPCLGVYNQRDHDQQYQAYRDAPTTFAQVRDFKRFLLADSENVCPDGQGRVPLTPEQRQHAHLDKEILVMGCGDHLEIWDPDVWAEYKSRIRSQYANFDGPILPQAAVAAADSTPPSP
ncbi:MAG: hypothetical protein LBL55_08000, partial [Propionibacteriaceae bacterium]|nr:hypothetical protein [Propionibacteriaceae bacterium]